MQLNTGGQNIKDTLQRLIDGLQRTLQVFQVLSENDVECGNIQEESCRRVGSPSRQYPVYKKKLGENKKYSRLDRRKFHTDEEDLDSSYDFGTGSSKILQAEIFTPRNLNEIQSGSFSNKSNIKPALQDAQCFSKKSKIKHPKKLTFFIEERELSDTVSVPKEKGDSNTSFCPPFYGESFIFPPFNAEKRKYRDDDDDEPNETIKDCPKNCPKQKYVDQNQPKRKKNRNPQEYKNASPAKEDITEEEERRPKEMDSNPQIGNGKRNGQSKESKGCCGGYCSRKCKAWRKWFNGNGSKQIPQNQNKQIKRMDDESSKIKREKLDKSKSDSERNLRNPSSGSEAENSPKDKYRTRSLLDLESARKKSKESDTKKNIKLKQRPSTSKIKKRKKHKRSSKERHKKRTDKYQQSKSLENVEIPVDEESREKQLAECCKPPKEQNKKRNDAKQRTSNIGEEPQTSRKSKKPKRTKKRSKRSQARREKYRQWLNWFLERRERKREASLRRKRTRRSPECSKLEEQNQKPVDSSKQETSKINKKPEKHTKTNLNREKLMELEELGDSDTGKKSSPKSEKPQESEKRLEPQKGRILKVEDFAPRITINEKLDEEKPICSICLEGCKALAEASCTKRIEDKGKRSETNLGVVEKVPRYIKKQKILVLNNSGPPIEADFVLIFFLNYEEQFGNTLERFLQSIQEEGVQFETLVSIDYLDTAFIIIKIPTEVAKNFAKLYDVKLTCMNPYFEYEKKSRCLCRNTILTTENSESSVIKRNRAAVKGDKPKEPTNAEKTRALYELLKIRKFTEELDDVGIWEMKRKGIIADAYPVHDGPYEWTTKGPLNERQLLRKYWAAIIKIFTVQPIQHIQRYFGPEAAYYFAFMDWYILMLIPVAVAGLITFLYGWVTIQNNVLVKLYCLNQNVSSKIVCSICEHPKKCGLSLFESCFNFRLTYLLDNSFTMWFGIFTSLWGLFFMVLWVRQQNSLKVSWNLHERAEIDLVTRPAYYKRAQKLCISKITGEPELQMTKCKEVLSKLFVIGAMLVATLLVLFVLFLLILYRIQLTAELAAANKLKGPDGVEIQKRSPAVRKVAITTAIISSVIIVIFSHLFDYVAIFLTNVENPQTQGEYDRSHILKLFLFSCINHYHMVIYLAFFRSLMYTHPGDVKMWRSYYGINADICDTSGCLIDVVCYITTLLIVKTLANIFNQLIIPYLIKTKPSNANCPQWELDYHLIPTAPYYFSKLNVEAVTQYGLVIFFMPAFPLLPLIALIVNAIDVRVNAKGLVQLRRRPIARQICERDLWNHILYAMTFIGIIIHGFVAAFVANYVELKTFERTKIFPPTVTYIEAAFTIFPVKHYANYTKRNLGSITECVFFGKRHLHHNGTHEPTPYYYQVLGNRLNVVAILLGLVTITAAIVISVVPIVANRTRQKINYLENEEIF